MDKSIQLSLNKTHNGYILTCETLDNKHTIAQIYGLCVLQAIFGIFIRKVFIMQ